MSWSEDLLDQLEFYWNVQLWPRLAGLSDDEYFWQPVGSMWSVRPDGSGVLKPDFLSPEPPIPPVTTIAWRLDHVTREVLGKRARALFGGSPAGSAGDADMYDDRHWPEPVPADAAAALASLDHAHDLWRTGVSAFDDETITRPLGPRGGPYAQDSHARHVLHINREVIAHGAEICLLRDLYRAEHDDRDPLVAAALRGDAATVGALEPSGARPGLAVEVAGRRHWDVLRVLVEAGAPTAGALHYAAAAGERDVAEWLVARGADLAAVDDRFGQTPAGWAQYCGHSELAELLATKDRSGTHH